MPSNRPCSQENGSQRHLTQAEISQRFKCLVQQISDLDINKHKHAERIAVLLDEIEYTQKILPIINDSFHDLWLPFPKGGEPEALEPEASVPFQEKQTLVLREQFVFNANAESPNDHISLTKHAIARNNFPHTLKYEKPLGGGGFGEVAKVTSIEGRGFALKRIERKRGRSREAKEQMQYIRNELDVLRRVRHLHYVKLVASYTDMRHVGILLDPVAECNLETYLKDFKSNRENQPILASFFGCLVTALDHLHNTWNIRHKDIKPQDILVHGNNVLFTDFGMALDWSESGISTTNEEKLRSPIYCSPEVAGDKRRNSSSDVWSLGCVFLEMAAVLKGRHWGFVRKTMETTGNKTIRYWDNLKGIENVLESLQGVKSGWGDGPLDWAQAMLQEEKDDRPTSRQLRDTIRQARSQSGQGFCGYCCTTADSFEEVEDEDGVHDHGPEPSSSSQRVQCTEATTPRNEPQDVKVLCPSTGDWIMVKLIRNDQASENWITEGIVAQCHLKTSEEGHKVHLTWGGVEARSNRYVQARWSEPQELRSSRAKFYVVPAEKEHDLPFGILIGDTLRQEPRKI